jgi:type 1 glutamine amidotransferase
LPDVWERKDEWYNFKNMNPDVHVLIKIDETSYEGGKNGDNHPMAWYHSYDGGRAFYTELGHTDETYSEPAFLQHLLGGIQYALKK